MQLDFVRGREFSLSSMCSMSHQCVFTLQLFLVCDFHWHCFLEHLKSYCEYLELQQFHGYCCWKWYLINENAMLVHVHFESIEFHRVGCGVIDLLLGSTMKKECGIFSPTLFVYYHSFIVVTTAIIRATSDGECC